MIFFIFLYIFNFKFQKGHLKFFIEKHLKNNLKVKCRKKKNINLLNKISIFQEVNFFTSVSLSGDQSSSQSTNKT